MIKEYNYYITTNRFSQIAEELDSAVRSYADSIGKDSEKELREKARHLCSEHLVKSGIRNKNNSFINIDTEFVEDGELVERCTKSTWLSKNPVGIYGNHGNDD